MNRNATYRNITSIALVSLLTLLCSCEKTLDFDYHDIEPIPVIEANLTQDGAELRFTYTTPMDEPMNLTPVKNATVTLYDVTTDQSAAVPWDGADAYRCNVPGIAGHTYRLDVEYNGESYSATGEMLPAADIRLMEFSWIQMPYDKVALLKVSIADDMSAKGDCYWMKVYRNGELYKWTQVRDDSASNGIIEIVMMTTRSDIKEEEDDELLLEGDEIKAEVRRISKEMYANLVAISSGANGEPMYSGPLALGYFLPSEKAASSIKFPARP